MLKKLNTPILLIGFNRPDLIERVFSQIRLVKPEKLYLAVDGARNKNEEIKVNLVKDIIKLIDWECEVKTLFADKNYGCNLGPVRAMNWFFQNEEMGIILEDDVLADESFFYYCQELLEKYKCNKKIGSISGNNFQFGIKNGKGDYYFSKYSHSCGWATWRRSWNLFDIKIKDYEKFKEIVLNKVFNKYIDKLYWKLIFSEIVDGTIDSAWDYQWNWMMWKNKMLGIIPNNNLVKNIGFNREDATHTKFRSKFAEIMVDPIMFPLKHPEFIVRSIEADDYTQKNNYILWKEVGMFLIRKYKQLVKAR